MIIEKQNSSKLGGYSSHLKNLTPEDRYTRFGLSLTDEGIDKFILSILYNLERHHIFAAIDNGKAVGYVHLAQIQEHDWELAISVDSDAQGNGIGNKLMSHAIIWAKTHGVENMYMNCITNNRKIQHLASKHGLKTIERAGSDITAMVDLPAPTTLDSVQSLVNEQTSVIKKIITLHGQLLSNLSMLSK